MKSTFLGIKKSILLSLIAIAMLFSFCTLCALSFTIFPNPDLWFYSFMLCLGVYEFSKGTLFDIDSSFYFGLLLTLFGVAGFVAIFFHLEIYFPLFFGTSSTLSSLAMYARYKQDFHLVLAFSLIFVSLYGYLFIKNLISLKIFIAFVTSFLLLLILSIVSNIKWRW